MADRTTRAPIAEGTQSGQTEEAVEERLTRIEGHLGECRAIMNQLLDDAGLAA